MDRHLSPAETAKRFGVSIKALRLYEQRGLLAPIRTSNGSTGSSWRAYGPDQIARLHRILALKSLGLSLAKIAELMASTDGLDPVLELQERKLAQDSERLAQALKLVRAARAKLASGQALSIDDLADLAKETVMTPKPTTDELKTLFKDSVISSQPFAKPLADKHLTDDDQKAIRAANPDKGKTLEAISTLIVEARALVEAGDPMSPAVIAWVRRWNEIRERIIGGNDALRAKLRDMNADSESNEGLKQHFRTQAAPLRLTEIDEFMKPARDYLKQTGEIAP
jgi:DNA-binding transcriptional MerR regulator